MKKEELCNFIKDISGWDECNTMVLRQIHKYVTECGLSYLDIARALSYYVDVLGNKLELQYGIGIVKFIYPKSRQYFAELQKQKQKQLAAAEASRQCEDVVVKVKINPNKTIRKKHIEFNDT